MLPKIMISKDFFLLNNVAIKNRMFQSLMYPLLVILVL